MACLVAEQLVEPELLQKFSISTGTMHNSNQISLHKEEFSLPPSSYHQREVNKSGAVYWEKTLMTDMY